MLAAIIYTCIEPLSSKFPHRDHRPHLILYKVSNLDENVRASFIWSCNGKVETDRSFQFLMKNKLPPNVLKQKKNINSVHCFLFNKAWSKILDNVDTVDRKATGREL